MNLWVVGFGTALLLRLLGGESILNFPAAIRYPWYDEETHTQNFPFKTLTMLIGFAVLLSVSYLTDQLIKAGKLNVDLNNLIHKYEVNGSSNQRSNAELYSMSNKGADFQPEGNEIADVNKEDY